jgi:hypothetical protein
VSISPTFYEQLLRQNPFPKKLQTEIESTKKLRKKLSYEKAANKILAKLTPVVEKCGGDVSPLNEGKSAASFCCQVAALVLDVFCNLYLVKNPKIANNSATT